MIIGGKEETEVHLCKQPEGNIENDHVPVLITRHATAYEHRETM